VLVSLGREDRESSLARAFTSPFPFVPVSHFAFTHAPNCLNNAAHDSGTLFGSARYASSNESKYVALVAFKKSSLIAEFGVGAGAFVAISRFIRICAIANIDRGDLSTRAKACIVRKARETGARVAIAIADPIAWVLGDDANALARESASNARRPRRRTSTMFVSERRCEASKDDRSREVRRKMGFNDFLDAVSDGDDGGAI